MINTKLSLEKSLSSINPELAAEWHPIKNNPLLLDQISPGSGKKVWWRCKRGHEWAAVVARRSAGTSCPYCTGKRAGDDNNLSILFPELAAEWHPEKNGSLKPSDVTAGSSRKVWWQCQKSDSHSWVATTSSRTRRSGCPYCAGKRVGKDNNLLAVHPELASEWHPTRNQPLTPDQFTSGSNKRIWWQCENGHEWLAMIASRSRGTGCPLCAVERRSTLTNATASKKRQIKN